MRRIKSIITVAAIVVILSIGSPLIAQTTDGDHATLSEQYNKDRDDDEKTDCGWIGLFGLVGLLGLLGLRKKKDVIVHTPPQVNKY